LEQPLPKSLPDSPIIIIFEHFKTKKRYEWAQIEACDDKTSKDAGWASHDNLI
jgi:hypothetical protein